MLARLSSKKADPQKAPDPCEHDPPGPMLARPLGTHPPMLAPIRREPRDGPHRQVVLTWVSGSLGPPSRRKKGGRANIGKVP